MNKQDITGLYLIAGFFIFIMCIFIWSKIEYYRENIKKRKYKQSRLKNDIKYNYLTGDYKHVKTAAGFHIEVGHYNKNHIKIFKRATLSELKFLKLRKYKKLL